MKLSLVEQKSPKSARKAKGDGHLRRIEILEAAERIFVADGYEGATIRKIADEVGVSSTALYMHFRDKDEILHEICFGALKQLLQQNSEIAARPLDAVTRVRLVLDAYARMGLNHPNAYHLVYCATPRVTISESPMQRATREIGAQCYECYLGVVRDIAAEGRLRVADAECAAQVLWTAVHGLVALMITRPNVDWRPADELISVMLDGLLNGLVTG